MVPETLEPSLQLASAVLSQLNMPPDDVQEAIQEFRRAHMGELQVGSDQKPMLWVHLLRALCSRSFKFPDPLPPLSKRQILHEPD